MVISKKLPTLPGMSRETTTRTWPAPPAPPSTFPSSGTETPPPPAPRGDWPPAPQEPLPPLHPRYGEAVTVAPTPPTPGPATVPGSDTPSPPSPAPGLVSATRTPAPSSTKPKGAGRGFVLVLSLAAAVLGAALALGAVWVGGGFDTSRGASSPAATTPVSQPPVVSAGSAKAPDVAAVAAAVRPAIVNIRVSSFQGQGSGSGVMFDTGGLIMTNNHVVDGASNVKVELTDGRTLDGEVVGTDPTTDIAVVRVKAKDLPAAKLGSATRLKIGQPVIAIGNPLGLDGGPTVSTGIVSALGRQVEGEGESLFDMIQTDAAISPGSSGGALLDAEGNVIGITTAKASPQAGAEGIGFATPINVAKRVADEIVTKGKASHPFLGVRGTDVSADQAGKLGVSEGALIMDVEPDSPAAKGGLRADDVVVSVDGNDVTSMSGLVVALRSKNVGDEVTLTVVRDGKREQLKVKLADRP